MTAKALECLVGGQVPLVTTDDLHVAAGSIGKLGDVDLAGEKRNSQLLGKAFDEELIVIGVAAAKLMVDVKDRRLPDEPSAMEVAQKISKGRGIGAP